MKAIQNIDDLRSEMLRLKLKCEEQENDLIIETQRITAKFRYPIIMLSKINEWFGVSSGNDNNDKDKNDPDWITNAMRVGLPVFLNKFFFPQSGIIMKSLVALVSQRAAKTVNKDMFTDVIDKISEWIKPARPRRRNTRILPDYGIPPDSETY